MTQSTPERQPCGTCGKPCTVTAKGGVRHHLTDNPDFQAGPDSRTCKGVGQPPATAAGVALAEDMESGQPQCRLCKHPVQLTGNGRVRSHLTPEATPRPCPAGSDFPLGTYPEIVGTTDGLVATLTRDCGHVPIGECYACYGEAGNPVSESEVDAMAEAEGTGAAPWGVAPDSVQQPTMADQLKATPTDDFGQPIRECFNCDRVGCTGCGVDDDTRTEAGRFLELAASGGLSRSNAAPRARNGGLSDAERERLAVIAEGFQDHRTDERKAADDRMSELTREVVKVLQQRSPEEKAETAARMDRTASTALGVPLDPALNHEYTDPSGTVWVHPGPAEECQTPDCAVLREASGDVPVIDQYGRIKGGGVYCEKCDTDNHRCPGCGTSVPHGVVVCNDCERELLARKLPRGETEDGRPCEHHEAQFGVEGDRLVCVACGTPCTHPGGFTENDTEEDDGEGLIFRCILCGSAEPAVETGPDPELPNCPHPLTHRAGCGCPDDDSWRREPIDGWRTPLELMDKMPEEIRGMDALRFNCAECKHPITPLVDQFSLDGRAAVVSWACENHLYANNPCQSHECRPDCLVNIGDLEFGDHFVRRGVLMRCTSSGYGVVEAVVVEGPMKGRTGELKNPAEQVERTYCRHNFTEPDGDGGLCCEYCGDLKTTTEQGTTECKDDRTAKQPPRSSAAEQAEHGTTGPGPAPGSKPPTKESAPTAPPRSNRATSSVPTAKASTNGRNAAVTTDQSAAAAAFLGGGRPAVPAANGSANQADAAAAFLAGNSGTHGEVETKRDRYGRYLIPHPDTGKEKAWTRSTTFAKSISDTYALGQWGLRMALLGATLRPDIVQRAHGKHVKADKQLLDELTADLKNAAGDKVAANLGTSMHSFTEMADRAWHSPGGPRSVLNQVPEEARGMVATYIRLLEETGLEPVPHLIEFTTVVKQYGVAGTSDNCYKVTKPLTLKIGRAEVRLEPGQYVIGDKKTGKDLDYGWQEIVIQLATYAQGINTAGVWDRQDEVWEPDPLSRFDAPGTKVRLDAGIVIHLPVDKEAEKQPAVYGVDLESGWNAAVLCERVRAWRNVRNLSSPVMVSEAPETFAPQRSAPAVVTQTTVRPRSLIDKARAVTSKSEASAVWKEAKQAGKSDAEVDNLVDVMQDRLRKLAEPGG